jgi:uncharacterized protein (DUF433 family)
MPTQVVSLRLKEAEAAYLTRQARRMQRTRGETAALLLAEKLREEEFPLIEFRPTLTGREPFLRGTRIKVWQVALHARDSRRAPRAARAIAKDLAVPVEKIQAALDYYTAYRTEINAILDDVAAVTELELRRLLPNLTVAPPPNR